MSDAVDDYLRAFVEKAAAAGLPVRKPGANWCALRPLAPGVHVSLSVAYNQIQVNLNNEDDADRRRFDRLYADRDAVEREIGEGLTWEKKDGRKKTAVRATMDAGYGEPQKGWGVQHGWAVKMMRRFQGSFGRRLG